MYIKFVILNLRLNMMILDKRSKLSSIYVHIYITLSPVPLPLTYINTGVYKVI